MKRLIARIILSLMLTSSLLIMGWAAGTAMGGIFGENPILVVLGGLFTTALLLAVILGFLYLFSWAKENAR